MPDRDQTVATVLDIYQRHIEDRPLERQCEMRTQCCRFKLTGKTPMVTLGEAIAAAAGWRAAGRKSIPEQEKRVAGAEGVCPFLGSNGRCENYRHRPLGCRTHVCDLAGGPYPRRRVADAIRELEALDEALGGDGPRPLPAAARDVWKPAIKNTARSSEKKRRR
jgi:uncharacterized protein